MGHICATEAAPQDPQVLFPQVRLSNLGRVPPARSCSWSPGVALSPHRNSRVSGCTGDRRPPTERRHSVWFLYGLRLSMASSDSRLGSCIHVFSAYRAKRVTFRTKWSLTTQVVTGRHMFCSFGNGPGEK